MPVELLTYADLADRLKISPEAARALAKRHRLPRSKSNDGKALVNVDLAEIRHKSLSGRSPGGDHAVTFSLKARIETLQAEIVRLEAAATGHRSDFERERDRADRLMTELLKATADTWRPRKRRHGSKASLRPCDHGPGGDESQAKRVSAFRLPLPRQALGPRRVVWRHPCGD